MPSNDIYTTIKPTYLYIKQHSITKKKYFGKTTQKDPYKYNGSGPYWMRHYKKHDKKHIKTLWVSDLYYDTSIVEIALHFSEENNIVKSNDWANQIPENGLDGGNPTPVSIQKGLDTKKERGIENPMKNPETIQKILETKNKNGTGSDNPEIIQKIKDTKKKNGTGLSNPVIMQKHLDTKKKNGTMNPNTPESIQKAKDTRERNGTKSSLQIPFLSLIDSKKTYPKGSITRWYPELKQYY